ncbi:hypothetical protein QVD17_40011 [Tagetes erecta]|uniref:Protein FAR1-RELATED SEQUENCE n=1 Tax=Tagetes erecta TaxID=13708 RepID=A0AAD8NFU5_TARER|nr:hypothetical protein QVD17_40011 [Tagetes erecta]
MDTHILFDLNELPVEEEDAIEEQSKAKKTICEEPFVGQCFLNEEEALVFYQNYARKNGFSVRKGRFVNKKGERKRRDFFCHREGKSEPKKDNTKKTRTRGYVRCECKAHMRITLRRINEIFPEEWQVTKFVPEHNHVLLSTQEVRFLPSYRNITLEDEKRILLLKEGGLSVRQIMRVMELEKNVDLAIEDVRQKQMHDSMVAKYQELHLKSSSPLEKQGYQVLTPFAFKKFQDQLALAIQYSAWKENDTSFMVKHYEAARLHKVVWDGKMAECTCKNFEFVGILCRHILSVFLHTGCFEIPCCYWLSRWSREEAQFNKVSHLHQEGTLDATSSFADYSDPITNAIELVQCPIISKTKGRLKQKRMKSGKELAKQVKRCRICKSSSHNFSTCPERHASNDANNAQHVAKKSKLDMQSEVDCNPIFHFKC